MAIKFLVPPTQSVNVSDDQVSDFGIKNLAFASRVSYYTSNGNDNDFNIDFDFGAAVTINYCYLGDIANIIRRAAPNGSGDSVTIIFRGDDNSGFSSPETAATVSLQLSDLMGLDNKDFYQALSFSTAYRYYRCKISTTTGDSVTLILSKLWFGFAYDVGISPTVPISVSYKDTPRYQQREITLNYQGADDTQRQEIYENLEKRKLYTPVVIVDEDDFFITETLLFTRLIDVEYITKANGIYDIRLIFETEY